MDILSLPSCETTLGGDQIFQVSIPPSANSAPWRHLVKLIKFMGFKVLGQKAPLSIQGVSSDVLKGLHVLVGPFLHVLGFLWAKTL